MTAFDQFLAWLLKGIVIALGLLIAWLFRENKNLRAENEQIRKQKLADGLAEIHNHINADTAAELIRDADKADRSRS